MAFQRKTARGRDRDRDQRPSRGRGGRDEVKPVRITGFFPTRHPDLWRGDITPDQLDKLNELVAEYGKLTIFLRESDDDDMHFRCYAVPDQEQGERDKPKRKAAPPKRKTKRFEPDEDDMDDEYYDDEGGGEETEEV